MRILLIGASGQIGRALRCVLPSDGEVIATVRTSTEPGGLAVELSNFDSVRQCVRELRPDVIVNAAAYTAVDWAETEVDAARLVNAIAPGVLAEEARRLGVPLVHYSTDYVFDGSGTRPWLEDDPTGPLNVYGQTKLEGEQAIQASGAAHLILRTSWVYDEQGKNFVRTMLRLGGERKQLSVVNDQTGAPTSAAALAEVTREILRQAFAQPDSAGWLQQHGGIVHACCQGETSWHGFALAIFALARQRGFPLAVEEVQPIASREYPTPARRPLNSRLDCARLSRRFGLQLPHWQTALEQTAISSQ